MSTSGAHTERDCACLRRGRLLLAAGVVLVLGAATVAILTYVTYSRQFDAFVWHASPDRRALFVGAPDDGHFAFLQGEHERQRASVGAARKDGDTAARLIVRSTGTGATSELELTHSSGSRIRVGFDEAGEPVLTAQRANGEESFRLPPR